MYYYFVKSKFKIKLYEPLHCEHMSCNHCKLQSKQEEFVRTQLVLRENANIFARECKSFARECKTFKKEKSSHPDFFPPLCP